MWKCDKAKIKSFGGNNPITVVRRGFLRYEAVQDNGFVVAKGIKLRKYYNPYIPSVPGSGALPGCITKDMGHWDDEKRCWVNGTNTYYLRMENPKKLNIFDVVCVWEEETCGACTTS